MLIEIEQITRDNTVLLDAGCEDVFDEPIDRARVAAYVRESNHLLLIAHADGRVVGQVLGVVHRHPDKATELYVDDLAVAESHQRLGIATRLLGDLVERARALGCEEIWVATEPENEPARALYASLGLAVRDVVVYEGQLAV